jgi:dipeptidyl aminopeptidase/acylaminoacyl peptidase
VVSSWGAQAGRLLRVRLADGDQRTVFADGAGYDVTGVHLDPVAREPRIAVVQRERRDLEVLDRGCAGDLAALRELCRGDISILGHDRRDRRWLVQDNTDDHPARYLLYDRVPRRARFLFSHLPELEPYPLARMEPFAVTVRDGVTVHGYLTFPPGAGRRALPAVLAVHGGPWSRDYWGFRAEPQWLANRGYLCVNVNFRGSTGYGRDFVDLGDREWGGTMQDDLTDVMRHLVRRGMADPNRLAILGASYGGYAALIGAAFTPGLFRCAIALAAPSDLRTFVGSIPPSWGLVAEELYRRVGHPVDDAEFLWSRSPLSRADRIRCPLLIAHGANDPRVSLRESRQLVEAVARRGVRHEFLRFPDEGHGLTRPANRLAFYAAAERFLAEHLGGRSAAANTETSAVSAA